MITVSKSEKGRLFEGLSMKFIRQGGESTPLILSLLMSAGLCFWGLLYFEGQVGVLLFVFYIFTVAFLSVLRLDFSLYLLIACVLIFDQYAIPGFSPLTHEARFFNNIKEIPYLPFFDAGVLNTIEIHLALLLAGLFIHASVRRDFYLRAIPVWVPFLLFAGSLIFSFVYGMRGGGDFLIALWEVRALIYLCLLYLIVPQIITTREQLTTLVWIFIIGISFKALQGVGRFVQLGFTTGGYQVLTNHEDPVFAVTLFILLLGLLVFRVRNRQLFWLFVLLLPLLLGFYVAQRRATYASLMVAISAFILLLPLLERRLFLKFFLPALAGILFYGALFWNSSATIGTPVQMVKSGIVKPDAETNYRDYHSNLYRDYENYNLAKTAVNNPIFGTGFGKRYEQPIPLVNIRFPLRDYIPHNQIIWVLVKTGTIGFFAFWFFFNAFVARGTLILNRLEDPYLKAVIIFVLIAVINQMVVSFFDLQLTYYRNMIYLGSLMGLLPAIERLGSERTDGTRLPVKAKPAPDPMQEKEEEYELIYE